MIIKFKTKNSTNLFRFSLVNLTIIQVEPSYGLPRRIQSGNLNHLLAALGYNARCGTARISLYQRSLHAMMATIFVKIGQKRKI